MNEDHEERMDRLSNETFVQLLEGYYGRLQKIHRNTLMAWLGNKSFSYHYLEALYQAIVSSYSTKYGKPCDLATVKEVHDSLAPGYVPPAVLIDYGQKMIGERYVEPEEGEKILRDLIAKLAKKLRVQSYKKGKAS